MGMGGGGPSIPGSYLVCFLCFLYFTRLYVATAGRSALLYVLPYAAKSGAASIVMCLLMSAWFTHTKTHGHSHTHKHKAITRACCLISRSGNLTGAFLWDQIINLLVKTHQLPSRPSTKSRMEDWIKAADIIWQRHFLIRKPVGSILKWWERQNHTEGLPQGLMWEQSSPS